MQRLCTALTTALALSIASTSFAGPKPRQGGNQISVMRTPNATVARIALPDLRAAPYYGAGSSGVAGTGYCGPMVGGKTVKSYPVPALPAGGTHVVNAWIPDNVWKEVGPPYKGTGEVMQISFKIEADSEGHVKEKNENNYSGGTCVYVDKN
ncbi:hypothetical protein [Halovulum sp. GXIMD14793]